MKVVALISGGKDSCYNMMQCVAAGHRVAALANLRPADGTDELDSYMYQTVGHRAVELYAEAMELPLYRRTIRGTGLDVGMDYSQTEGDEVEDLFQLLRLVREKEAVEAVSVGAILSNYQRARVEHVCRRLGLVPLAYLWRRDQEALLSEMISSKLHAVLVKVAAFGLDPDKHLGKPLADMEHHLRQLSDKYGGHVCGEGGEYETITLDCPLFKKKIVIDAMETVIHSADAFTSVGYLRFTRMHTEDKHCDAIALPHDRCPCQNAIDKMTEALEYADHAEDERREFTSNCDLSRQQGLASERPPSCSPRSSRGYQWISGINGLQSTDPGIEGQTVTAFALLQAELDSRGWQMKNIVLVHLYVSSVEDFGPLNDVYKKHFGVNPPARVCVQAPLPAGQLLQLDCLLHDRTQPLEEDVSLHRREALHVQSVSHWAPASMGPYSQALRVDELVFCAGQIALVPCTMQLVKAGIGTQARLSFSHVEKVLDAAIGGLNLGHVLQAHVYATRRQDVPAIRAVWESSLRAAREKDSFGDPENHQSPLLVAVVSALPKAASVELHVTAVRDDPRERTSCHVTTKSGCGLIECQTVASSDSQSATLSLSLGHVTPDSDLEVLDVKEALWAISDTFNSTVKKMESGLMPLCARVFYKYDHSSAVQIATGLEECLRTSVGQSSPSVALVPVLDLPDSLILQLSCWLSV